MSITYERDAILTYFALYLSALRLRRVFQPPTPASVALRHLSMGPDARGYAKLHMRHARGNPVVAFVEPVVVVPKSAGASGHNLEHASGAAMPCLRPQSPAIKPTLKPRQGKGCGHPLSAQLSGYGCPNLVWDMPRGGCIDLSGGHLA